MNDAIKAFTEKKATAKTMGVMWSIVSLLWLGMTIFCICIKQYGDLWATINLFLAASVLAVNNFASISDYELSISAIELAQIDREIILHDISHWHDYTETPENKSYVLAYLDGKYVVLFFRDALYEYPPYYDCNWAGTTRVDRWMYIPGNVKSE